MLLGDAVFYNGSSYIGVLPPTTRVRTPSLGAVGTAGAARFDRRNWCYWHDRGNRGHWSHWGHRRYRYDRTYGIDWCNRSDWHQHKWNKWHKRYERRHGSDGPDRTQRPLQISFSWVGSISSMP